MLTSVSIIVPTFRRLHLLPRVMESCLNQRGIGHTVIEVVIVDNSPEGAAQEVVNATLGATEAPRVLYVHEPQPGISQARNAGLRASRGDFVIFLDDDQIASPGLVAAYLKAWRDTGADALFGPIRAEAEAGGAAAAWILRYHSRDINRPHPLFITRGELARLGTSNSFLVRRACLPDPDAFEESLAAVGGEDTLLFRQLVLQGRRFAWVDDAVVREKVSPGRMRPEFIRWRRFRSGQIRTLTCLLLAPPRRTEAVLWMAAGAAQVVLYGLLTPILFIVDRGRGQETWSRVFGGAGKILWMKRFLFPAYGHRAKLPI